MMVAPALPHLNEASDLYQAYADALRPLPEMTPAEFAEKHRFIKEGTSERPGQWSNEHFPYLVDIMNVSKEALETGKRGVVLMKSGQGGGSEAMINSLCYLQAYHPGPSLYLISKEEVAREFGRERFGYIFDTCEPLARKALKGKGSGNLTHIKRFTDGKFVLHGGKSILNLQTHPYKFVGLDEVDSLQDEVEGQGDPIKIAEVRLDSYSGEKLMTAWGHPTTRDRGAGKLYYELSDQRRGFVTCPHCNSEFWLQWEHVKAFPKYGMNEAQAERDPSCYQYIAPCCGVEITDSQRYSMIRHTRQKSILPPEVAAQKTWIGVHFSQLYMPNKPLAFLAEKWIEGLNDEATKRVFFNKRLGDVYDASVTETTQDEWRSIIVLRKSADDPEYYELGQVPRGVRFLTAGQDSRSTELHWAIWGWGLLRNEANYPELCGWLISAGVQERKYDLTLRASELAVFDQLYDTSFPSTDGKNKFWVHQGLHDTGWQHIAVYEYCRRRTDFRALPSKGAAEEAGSNAPPIRWAPVSSYKIGDEEVKDPGLKLALLNTFTLKEHLFGLVGKSFKRVSKPGLPATSEMFLHLPHNIESVVDKKGKSFIEHLSNERLVVEKKKLIWKAKGAQHWLDCTINAFAAAINSDPFQESLSFDEAEQLAQQEAEQKRLAEEKRLADQRRTEPTPLDRYNIGQDWVSR